MKRAKSIAVASILTASMLASSVVGFAADYDLKHKTDPAKNTKILTILKKANRDQFKEVARNMKDYYIEYGGKDFELKAYDAKWTEAVSKHPDLVKDGKITEKMIFGFEPMPAEATIAPLAPSVQEFEVTEISAISPRAFRVNFNRAVTAEEEAKLTFEVKKGGVVQAVTVKVAADKKSASLEKAADFVNGKYTVLAKLDGKELMKKEIEIKAEEATSIVIKSDKIAKDTVAALDVEILNQYKEKLTGVNPVSALTAVAKNKTEPGRTVTVINALSYNTENCELGDEIEITIFLNADTSVRVTKVVPVGYVAPQGTEVAFGEVVMAGAKTEINPNDKGIELPMTVKKNGSEIKPTANSVVLSPGNNLFGVFLAPVGNELKVFFDKDAIENLKFNKTKKAFVFDVKADAKPGSYTVKVINDLGEEYQGTFEVKKAEAPARIEFVNEAPVVVDNGKGFDVAFKLIGDRGNELKWSDFAAANVKELKQEKADGTAGGVATKGAWTAPKMPYTAAAASGKITFILNDGTKDIEGTELVANVTVNPAIDNIIFDSIGSGAVTLTAGETIDLTIKARNAGNQVLDSYNTKWENVKFTYGAGDAGVIYKDVQFQDGIAKVTLKPTTALAAEKIKVKIDTKNAQTDQNVEVKAGEPSKPGNPVGANGQKALKFDAQDEFGNKTAFAGKAFIKISFDQGDQSLAELADDGTFEATFAAGTATITFTKNLAAGSTYTIEYKGKTLTHTVN